MFRIAKMPVLKCSIPILWNHGAEAWGWPQERLSFGNSGWTQLLFLQNLFGWLVIMTAGTTAYALSLLLYIALCNTEMGKIACFVMLAVFSLMGGLTVASFGYGGSCGMWWRAARLWGPSDSDCGLMRCAGNVCPSSRSNLIRQENGSRGWFF